ncbi:hypothetical protein HHL22_09945 [Hymenobacter sp. RP-2-7]|uniref:Alpha-2-macroglobulin domain-containing protein n=1 Tax=Hymenobacter polaris TaxID=2682546 RepID=A0A7Y0AEB3_9BACT|nr:carboxypeptidase-like regulatory domain-containing protein [Hymenobacter polaris]NML65525.1 hypothetical protein [Hymenobacter polaris]
MFPLYQLALALVLCWLSLPVLAQQPLARARQRSYLTKIFRLTQAQTRQLFAHGLQAARPNFFTVPVDSFPTDSALVYQAHPRPLPLGYYLVAHTEGPQLVYWLRAETGRTLEVLDNQTDLVLVLRDSLGGLVPDARVALRRRAVPYDAATRTYRLAGAGRAGLVAVTQGGRTTFHPLTWQNAYSPGSYGRVHWLRRVGYRALYGFPLGYLSQPVRRTVQDLQHASEADFGVVGLLRSPFNEDVREERHSQRAQRRWRGYLLLSEPRYRPTGDTLRLKARVLRRGSGRPYTRPLTLWLSGNGLNRAKRLAELRPVRPGTYEYALPLTDTLGLRADTRPMLELEDRRGATLLSESFRYEDYELKNSHYTLRLLEEEPRRGQPQAVFVRGTDANGLNLLDARVQLAVVPVAPPGALPGRRLFVADTLWTHAQALDPVGETRIDLPARIFPNADFSYDVRATLLTADNERRTEHRQAVYHRDAGRLLLTLSADTLRASYDSLGRRAPHRAWLEVVAANETQHPRVPERVLLPLTRPLDPLAAAYVLRDDANRTTRLYLAPDNASLQLQSDRTADSVHLRVDNPRRLPFWYFVYRGQVLRYRGYGTAYALDLKDGGDEPWHVSLHYRWGAATRAAEYTVAAPQRQLLITTTQPDLAYPGQHLRLGFTVTDEAGRPVPDADLAAYAYTSKFEASAPPALPSYARPVAGRRSRRRFALRAGLANDASQAGRQSLDWPRWQHQLGLDSLQFYHFLYPETGTFFEYRSAPGGLTQVAPFVVDSGRVQPPVAFYLDEQPAYIEALGNQQPYAAVAGPGLHTLRLRLPTRDITLRDVYLQPGHKLTLSIDPNHPCRELTVAPRPAQLTPTEDLGLRRAIVAVRDEPGTVALRQGPALRPLGPPTYRGLRLAGPFRPDSLQLLRLRGATSRFLFEPLYDYTFYPRTIKQSCLEPSTLGYLNGTAGRDWLPLGDFALTSDYLQHLREPAFGYRPRLLAPAPQGSGRLVLRLPYDRPPGTQLAAPLYTLLTRPDQPKFSRLGYGLEPMAGLAPGRYQVAVLLADSTSLLLAEPVLVEAHGTTYVQLRGADHRPGDALRRRIERLFAGLAQQLAPNEPPARRETRAEQPSSPRPDWRTLVGRVTDAQGEGLPGVTVLAKNTTFGVSTNVDGYYALQVPPQVAELVFSYVGYVRQELVIGNHSVLNTSLVEDVQQLQEVVVVGYGVQQRANLTGSVMMLQGRVAGVQINGQPGVRIRGNSSVTASNPPLLIVNGLPFSGDLSQISPQDILETKVLKSEAATGIYGARGANGVILITTRAGATFRPGAAGAAPELLPGADPRLSLRRHFRDNAWWRPTLLTDALGRAHTDVVLPDDVTGWDTFVVGSDGHGRVGGLTGRLRSFKALRAELAVPRFLVAGDRVQALGKVLNYQGDTAAVTTSFRQGGRVLRQQARRVAASALDTLTFTAPPAQLLGPPDSLEITFVLSQASGYADGEQRRLPVLPAGTTEQVGTFVSLLPADTTVRLPLDPRLGPATVRIERDALPVLLAEIEHLEQYAYLCNEQMASRLQGLLLEQRIRAAQGQPFRRQRNVNFLIRRLLAGRHQPEGLWGTWPTSAVSPWATLHVVEALQAASEAGFAVNFNRDEVVRYLLAELDATLHPRPVVATNRPTTTLTRGYFFAAPDDQIRLLHVLHALHAPADYPTYVRRLEQQLSRPRLPLDRYLALTELRQKLALPYQLDTLRRYRLRTTLGGALYADTLHVPSYFRYLLPDRVGTTLLAYRVLRTQGGHEAELTRLRAYLLGLRGGGHWLSTYQTAQILATIGPDLLAGSPAGPTTQVDLSGAPELPSGPQTQFPLALKLPTAPAALTIRKTGPLPVYATAYQTRWVPSPEAATKPFTVTTTLGGQAGRRVQLPAGRPTELVITVEAPAESRYVLLEVPIPAGCSYGDPAAPSPVEVHREYLKQQVGIFIDYLPAGRHTFRVALQPRYRGQYTLNPARAELLYFPTKFGRTTSKQVRVQ